MHKARTETEGQQQGGQQPSNEEQKPGEGPEGEKKP